MTTGDTYIARLAAADKDELVLLIQEAVQDPGSIETMITAFCQPEQVALIVETIWDKLTLEKYNGWDSHSKLEYSIGLCNTRGIIVSGRLEPVDDVPGPAIATLYLTTGAWPAMTRPAKNAIIERRCSCFAGGQRCDKVATHRLFVDGRPAWGGYVCQQHGEEVVAEYSGIAAVVGVWTVQPIEATQ